MTVVTSSRGSWYLQQNRGIFDHVRHEELDETPATEEETRNAVIARSGRTAAPIRKIFVQTPRSEAPDPANLAGPLSLFVTHRDLRALNAYLLILAATSSGDGEDGWSTTHPIMVWARAFGTTQDAARPSAANAVSKILHRLEQRRLIERDRRGRERRIQVALLREDGSGKPYTRPLGASKLDRFLNLNHAFWTDGWCDRLKLPGLAMLLVALHETGRNKPYFRLPAERVPEWYGWSADTTERGLAELQEHGLIHKISRARKEPLSPSGLGRVNDYYLLRPFGHVDTATLFNAQVEAVLERTP